MTKILVKCNYCNHDVEKERSEYNRRIRKDGLEAKFYCNHTCSVLFLGGWKNVPAERRAKHGRPGDDFTPFRTYLRRCKRRKHECDLTLEYLKELWELQNHLCAITRLPIELGSEYGKNDSRNTASLDRIDSSLGYVKGNVQWTSTVINLAKQTMTQDQILEWIDRLRTK